MAKKKVLRKGYVSKGTGVSNVSAETRKAMRKDKVSVMRKMLNKVDAWRKGKNVYVTVMDIPSDVSKPVKERFKKMKATDVLGWSSRRYSMSTTGAD